jgi:hypothetical protein
MIALDLQRLLPPKIKSLCKLIGYEEAIKLVDCYPNKRLYIPCKPTDSIGFLSPTAQDLLCENYGGTVLVIPKCASFRNAKRNQEIQDKHKNGEKITRLAQEYAMSYKWMYLIINE